MGDYTPNEQELIEGSTVSEDERRRAIARIKAEALRGLAAEVADALKGGVSARQGSRMQYAVGLMTASANQIEKEAGL